MCITLQKNLPPINVRFCGQILENVTSHPYLAVQLDSKLCWKEHFEFVVKGANKILGLIRRNFWFCDKKVKLTLYKTLVRPKLEPLETRKKTRSPIYDVQNFSQTR